MHAASSEDETTIEQEIDQEDDGSPDGPMDGLPESEVTPPPAFDEPLSPETSPPATAAEPEQEPQLLHDEPAYDGTTRATQSGQGEPIFDWSKHQGETEVPHPFREKGLIRITKDREYLYKVNESPQSRAFTFHVGLYHPNELANPDNPGQVGATFDENYQSSNSPSIMLDYEWQLWKSPVGKWGLKVGSGLFVAQGNGHFAAGSGNPNAGLTPREVFTFALVPVNVGAVYRLQLWHRQMLVPYAEGGGTLFGFSEFRDDNKGPKFGGALGAYFAAGGALNLTYFDPRSRIRLDREYGINAVYLTAEFRQIISITKRYDFTSNLVNGGFLMEY